MEPTSGTNPFAAPSALPFQAPPFDRIRDSDYAPAFDTAMREHLAEIDSIAALPAAPTFDNTIVAQERSGRMLSRVSNAFNAVAGANTNDVLQRTREDVAPKLAAHFDAIFLNGPLYARIKAVYDQRDKLGLTPEQKYLVETYRRDFVKAGAELSDSAKAALKKLNAEEASLSAQFENKLRAAAKAGALVVSDKAELDGLGEGPVAAAAEAARERGLAGKWVLPLQNTTQQPAQVSLANRATRQALFEASIGRAERGDSNDTRAIIERLAQLRAGKAQLFGFPTYAAYAIQDQVAKTPEAAIKLLTDLAPAAVAKSRDEMTKMQALIDRERGGFRLAAWDYQYYAEQVRKAEYALDESQVKQYFVLDTVLQDGVFYAANQLYGLTFRERKDIPVYNPDVRTFEVFDADGQPLALFYADYFKRDNKNGGAWMDNLVDQSTLLGTKPVVYNVANFTKPAPGQPALLSFDDVTTMFHEFGHALHGMLSNVTYPSISGTRTPRDFVEFPSQFNEHWALEPRVFANYAKHYQSGAPMPAELAGKIRKARTFNQGFATLEYLEAALLDFAWHTLPANAPLEQPAPFEKASLERYHVLVPEVPPRYRSTYFLHIWANGYSAAYYAYMWSEVLDHDTYYWFKDHGGMTRANGQRLRDLVLSRGHTADPGALFRSFVGRDPYVEPLLIERGLKPAK
ncbi:MAG: M3 family metallopeptidase [Gemmatimonadaceae bacterium]|nr:M3 family metallopeptidase [Gemmatimonadaceae bacterium]